MGYCTSQDILSACDETDLIRATDDFDTGIPDPATLAQGIDRATALIDSYIAGRYGTNLDPVPPLVVSLCLDISLYKLMSRRGDKAEEFRVRYDDAIKMLERIASGKADIPGIIMDEDTGTDDPAAAVVSRPGHFTESGMDGY